MGIAPIAELRIEPEIFIPDIKPSDITGYAVYDNKLSVVAVIQPKVNRPEL